MRPRGLPSTRAWVKSWVHESACGGFAGRVVATAVDRLLEDGGMLLSLDYAKCFDTIDPNLVLRCLQYLGCPLEVISSISLVWQQTRWLCYNGEYLKHPCQVSTSIPQGDAISPLSLLALLTGLTARVVQEERQLGHEHTVVTYLDDRNLIARTVQQTVRLWRSWKARSAEVGLWENDAKVRVVARKASDIPVLLDEFQEDQVVSSTRVLGVDFTARLGAACRTTQEQRLAEAKLRCSRIALLPCGGDFKAQLVAILVVPKAVWGAWTKLVSARAINVDVKYAAGSKHPSMSSDLFYLLAGHGLSVEFCSGYASFSSLAASVR